MSLSLFHIGFTNTQCSTDAQMCFSDWAMSRSVWDTQEGVDIFIATKTETERRSPRCGGQEKVMTDRVGIKIENYF